MDGGWTHRVRVSLWLSRTAAGHFCYASRRDKFTAPLVFQAGAWGGRTTRVRRDDS
jgi:hypothetical protein